MYALATDLSGSGVVHILRSTVALTALCGKSPFPVILMIGLNDEQSMCDECAEIIEVEDGPRTFLIAKLTKEE